MRDFDFRPNSVCQGYSISLFIIHFTVTGFQYVRGSVCQGYSISLVSFEKPELERPSTFDLRPSTFNLRPFSSKIKNQQSAIKNPQLLAVHHSKLIQDMRMNLPCIKNSFSTSEINGVLD